MLHRYLPHTSEDISEMLAAWSRLTGCIPMCLTDCF